MNMSNMFCACNFVIRQRSSCSQYNYSKFTTDIIISCIFIGLDQLAHADQCPDIIIIMTCALPRFTYRIPVFLQSVAYSQLGIGLLGQRSTAGPNICLHAKCHLSSESRTHPKLTV